MKTLIVHYLARQEDSHTGKLLKAFRETLPADAETVELDLVRETPDFFLTEQLQAYIRRNYLGQELDPAAAAAMARMDRMTAQLKEADIVVLASPMYNFSLPAAVKAWFDSVMLKGQTWDSGPDGFHGLQDGKKALVLSASGGVYEGTAAGWDHFEPLVRTEFAFMGYSDIRVVKAAGVNSRPDKVDEIVTRGQEEVRTIVREWYG